VKDGGTSRDLPKSHNNFEEEKRVQLKKFLWHKAQSSLNTEFYMKQQKASSCNAFQNFLKLHHN